MTRCQPAAIATHWQPVFQEADTDVFVQVANVDGPPAGCAETLRALRTWRPVQSPDALPYSFWRIAALICCEVLDDFDEGMTAGDSPTAVGVEQYNGLHTKGELLGGRRSRHQTPCCAMPHYASEHGHSEAGRSDAFSHCVFLCRVTWLVDDNVHELDGALQEFRQCCD